MKSDNPAQVIYNLEGPERVDEAFTITLPGPPDRRINVAAADSALTHCYMYLGFLNILHPYKLQVLSGSID